MIDDVEFYLGQFEFYFNTNRKILVRPNLEEWIIEVPYSYLWDILGSKNYHTITDSIYNFLLKKAEDAFEDGYKVLSFTDAKTMGSVIKIYGQRKQE